MEVACSLLSIPSTSTESPMLSELFHMIILASSKFKSSNEMVKLSEALLSMTALASSWVMFRNLRVNSTRLIYD